MTVPLMIDTSSLPHLFFLAAFASAIAWIVLVAMGSTDTKTPVPTDAQKVYATDNLDQIQRTTTVCFQGAVVGILFYFAFKHHHAGL